jgi:hypothetical protein
MKNFPPKIKKIIKSKPEKKIHKSSQFCVKIARFVGKKALVDQLTPSRKPQITQTCGARGVLN